MGKESWELNEQITFQLLIFNNPIKVSEESVNFDNETGRARNLYSLTFNKTESVLRDKACIGLTIINLPCWESHVSV